MLKQPKRNRANYMQQYRKGKKSEKGKTLSNDEIIKSMYEWYLSESNPLDLHFCFLFRKPTFHPSQEEIDFVVKQGAPSNLRQLLEDKKTELTFATLRHFDLTSRTRAWEYVELWLSDYFVENSQFLPAELIESKRKWKISSLKFWSDFQP